VTRILLINTSRFQTCIPFQPNPRRTVDHFKASFNNLFFSVSDNQHFCIFALAIKSFSLTVPWVFYLIHIIFIFIYAASINIYLIANQVCLFRSCFNGGSCLPDKEKQTFSCSCLPSWTGDRCEVRLGSN